MKSYIVNFDYGKNEFIVSCGRTTEGKYPLDSSLGDADIVLLKLGIKYSEDGVVLYASSVNNFPTMFKENNPKNTNNYVWAIDGNADFVLNESMLKKSSLDKYIRHAKHGDLIFTKDKYYTLDKVVEKDS